MRKILVDFLPYKNPKNFFYYIHEFPYSFYMDACWSKNENYSICGFSPFLIFKSKRKNIEIKKKGRIKKFKGNPLKEFQKIFNFFDLNFSSFFGPGGFGFLSYDLAWEIEKLPDKAIDDLLLPDIFVCFYDTILIFDNLKKKAVIMSFNFEDNKNFKYEFKIKKRFFKSLLEKNSNVTTISKFTIEDLNSNMTVLQYISSIEKIRNYIKEGDVYQINFSHRFQIKGNFQPYNLFFQLNRINPAPYSAYFNCGDFILISNSPELFLKKIGEKIITKPMKGTRRRDNTCEKDKEIVYDLLKSEKDIAELIMIVDLERNDFGKICEYGTVKVKKLRNLEKYKTVYQTTSTIEGNLKNGVNLEEIIKAIFPGGSVTGAPKKRAIEIIEELEPTKRNFYTGSFGYFGFNGNLHLNILIRTLLLKKNFLYYPVGGGIVWDSIPEREYEETLTKARNLFLTIGVKEDEIGKINL